MASTNNYGSRTARCAFREVTSRLRGESTITVSNLSLTIRSTGLRHWNSRECTGMSSSIWHTLSKRSSTTVTMSSFTSRRPGPILRKMISSLPELSWAKRFRKTLRMLRFISLRVRSRRRQDSLIARGRSSRVLGSHSRTWSYGEKASGWS